MASNPTAGMGVTLLKSGTAIASVTNINPTINIGEAETTPLDSEGRMSTFVPTKVDVEISLELNWLPTPGAGDHEADILDDVYNVAAPTKPTHEINFAIVWSDASATRWNFDGFWRTISPNADRDNALVASATIRVTHTSNFDWSA